VRDRERVILSLGQLVERVVVPNRIEAVLDVVVAQLGAQPDPFSGCPRYPEPIAMLKKGGMPLLVTAATSGGS